MRFTTIANLGAVLALLAINPATAQSKNTSVCFVNAQAVMKSHPKGDEAAKTSEAANKELTDLRNKLQAIQNKITLGTATAADHQQFEVLTKTFNETSKKWQQKIDVALQPITKDIDAAVSRVAKAAGCEVVLDRATAQLSGLVVYADPATDITADVSADLKKTVK